MKRKTIYIADDGTHFDDEIECMKYDLTNAVEFFVNEGDISFADEEGNEVTDPKVVLSGETIYQINIKTDLTLKLVKDLNEWNGYFFDIDSLGVWKYYTDRREGWYKVG